MNSSLPHAIAAVGPIAIKKQEVGSESWDKKWQVPGFKIEQLRPKQRAYCLVIPVLNEGSRLHHLLNKIVGLNLLHVVDVIVVDGGSEDGSTTEHQLAGYGLCAILRKTGPGKLSAQLRCGYAWALHRGYVGILTIDGNNKDDPSTIPQFVRALDEGYDFVQASRYLPGGEATNTPKLRHVAIRYLHAPILSFVSGFCWTDTTQGYRAYSRRLLEDERVAPFRNVFDHYELLAYLSYRAPRLGFRCKELATARRYPKGEVPTKIGMFGGNLTLLAVLAAACTGRYNPRRKETVSVANSGKLSAKWERV